MKHKFLRAALFRVPTLIVCTIFFQYGFVNYALELLVLQNYGKETWERIK